LSGKIIIIRINDRAGMTSVLVSCVDSIGARPEIRREITPEYDSSGSVFI
jgi:hypothetical protein